MSMMSLKDRLTIVEKQLNDLNTNIKTYHQQVQTLRHAKQSFEKAFNAKNADIRRGITTELERVFEQLQRHLSHHKTENSRIQQQLAQLREEKEKYQIYLRSIREKLEDIERNVGEA